MIKYPQSISVSKMINQYSNRLHQTTPKIIQPPTTTTRNKQQTIFGKIQIQVAISRKDQQQRAAILEIKKVTMNKKKNSLPSI